MGVYTAFERVPGQIYSEGQGMFMLEAGEGAIFNGHGVTEITGDGMSMKVRFSLVVQASGDGTLGKLNNMLLVGEQEVDGDGNTHSTLWEWK